MIKGKGTRIKEKKRDYSKSICKGLSEYFLAIFLTQVGIVAEKSMLCRSNGEFLQ
jgi:hypothetical protein